MTRPHDISEDVWEAVKAICGKWVSDFISIRQETSVTDTWECVDEEHMRNIARAMISAKAEGKAEQREEDAKIADAASVPTMQPDISDGLVGAVHKAMQNSRNWTAQEIATAIRGQS